MSKAIMGYENEKMQLNQLRTMLENSDKYLECGVRIPRGLVLCGEPGVGKTVMARSIASEGIDLFELKPIDCHFSNVADDIEEAFEHAKANSPCVLLIDELDKIANVECPFPGDTDRAVNKTLLKELDSLSDDDKVLVVATCNDERCLGEALLRPGRFDRVINVPVPDEQTRRAIIAGYFAKLKIAKNLDYDYLAGITSGYSGAYIECLANEVGIDALSMGKSVITLKDVRKVMDRISFKCDSKDNIMSKDDRYKLAVHEAGHCLVTMILNPGEIVDVTIRPQGKSNGCSISAMPENRMMTVSDGEKLISQMLGGYVAERIVLKEHNLGSGSDMKKALELATSFACEEGAYGYRYLRNEEFIMISEAHNNEITECIISVLERQDRVAENVINEHRELFDAIVNALVERQVLSKAELEEMMAAVEQTAA